MENERTSFRKHCESGDNSKTMDILIRGGKSETWKRKEKEDLGLHPAKTRFSITNNSE